MIEPARGRPTASLLLTLGCLGLLQGCTPTVEVKPPSEPITINLNVKIQHEIRIKVGKELEELFRNEEEIF